MNFKTGKIEYNYDEKLMSGTVIAGSKTYISSNAIELLNIFMNEIDGRIRRQVQSKLETAGINKYTGIVDNESIESSC